MTVTDQGQGDGLEAHPTQKLADTPKTLPWTDKSCHIVGNGGFEELSEGCNLIATAAQKTHTQPNTIP